MQRLPALRWRHYKKSAAVSRSALTPRSLSFATVGSHLVAQALQPWVVPLVSFSHGPQQRAALLQLLGQIEAFAQATLCNQAQHALGSLFPPLLFQLQTRFAVEAHMMAWLRYPQGSAQQHLAEHTQILHTLGSSYAQRHTLGAARTVAQIQQCLQEELLPHITEQDQALARSLLAHPPCAEVH